MGLKPEVFMTQRWKNSDEAFTPVEAVAVQMLAELFLLRVRAVAEDMCRGTTAADVSFTLRGSVELPIAVAGLQKAQSQIRHEAWRAIDHELESLPLTPKTRATRRILSTLADRMKTLGEPGDHGQ